MPPTAKHGLSLNGLCFVTWDTALSASWVTKLISPSDSKFIIEKILPTNRVHLLAGASNVGKSRFIIPALIMAHGGYPIMGLKSSIVPWCLVSSDRPLADVRDSIASVGFKESDVPIIPAFGAHKKTVPQVMTEVEKLGVKFILWEGLDMIVTNSNSGGEVAEFVSRITAYCEKGLTILGTTGVAKLKPHEVYANPRQLVAGSSVWERATSSNLIIVPVNPWDPSCPDRLLYCTLKNDPSFSVAGKFDEGGILTFDNWTEHHIGAKVAQLVGKKSELENINRILTSDRFLAQN